MKNLKVIFCLLILIPVGFSDCSKKYDDGPKINWQSGSIITYNYNSGVIAGFTAHLKYIVIDDKSGEIQFVANLDNDEKSLVTFVESGKEYTLRIICSFSTSGKSGTIYVKSPSVTEPYEISTSDNKVNLGSLTSTPR